MNFFSDNTRVRIFIFLSRKARIFFPEFNIMLYDNNSESDFFFLHQNQNIFFSATLGIRIFFFRKKTIPPLEVKWSFPYDVFFFTCFWVNLWTAHFYQLGALLLRKGVKCHSPILQLFSASSSFVFFNLFCIFLAVYVFAWVSF